MLTTARQGAAAVNQYTLSLFRRAAAAAHGQQLEHPTLKPQPKHTVLCPWPCSAQSFSSPHVLCAVDQTSTPTWVRHVVWELGASSRSTAGTSGGQTRTTRRAIWALSGRSPSQVPPTPRASFWRRLALRPSSPTLPFVSAPVCSLSRTARRSQPSCPWTAASTSLRRTTRC